jgi:broad specificity phosphatase PhoE
MGVILLIRHGQASFGGNDYDVLSEQGHAQARHTGAVLATRGIEPARVISGSLRRQRDTAEGLLAGLGRAGEPVVEDPRWNEYDQFGLLALAAGTMEDWPDDPVERNRAFQVALDRALAVWVAAGAAPPPEGAGGESHDAFHTRTTGAIDDLLATPGTSVVVSSGGAIAAVAAHLMGVAPEHWPAINRTMVNASITKVVTGRRGATLVSLNEHGHLEGVDGIAVTYR